jgi:hypothetical protein
LDIGRKKKRFREKKKKRRFWGKEIEREDLRGIGKG